MRPVRSSASTPNIAVGVASVTVDSLVATWPTAAGAITWRNAPAALGCGGRFAAQRVTPAHDWRQRALAPEIWLLAEQVGAQHRARSSYFVHLSATALRRTFVRPTHQRWTIEQQYQELKRNWGSITSRTRRGRAGTCTAG